MRRYVQDADNNIYYNDWTQHPDGSYGYSEQDGHGQAVRQIQDVDTDAAGAPALPGGWSARTTGLNLKTTYTYDDSGQQTSITSPDGRKAAYAYGSLRQAASGTDTTIALVTLNSEHLDGGGKYDHAPLRIEIADLSGRTLVSAMGLPTTGGDGSLSNDWDSSDATLSAAFSGTITAKSEHLYEEGHLIRSREYTDLAAPAYLDTTYTYDALGRAATTTAPDGTITKSVYDALGRAGETQMGTSVPGLARISRVYYDGADDADPMKVGDGHVTGQRRYHGSGSGDYYAAKMQYDWRGRVVQSRGADGVASKQTLDNLGRTTLTETYADADGDFVLDSGELRAKSESFFDERGRMWKSVQYEVSGGTAGDRLSSTVWHDAMGRRIKGRDANGLLQKSQYDSAGRLLVTYMSYDSSESSYADAATVVGDTVIEQTVLSYTGGGEVSLTTHYQRTDSTIKTGDLSGSWAASDSRRTFSVQWYDALGRPTTSASYGTNGDAALADYDPATSGNQAYTDTPPAPNSHDQIIVSKSEYDSRGQAYRITDNKGIVTQLAFDDLGRQTKLIENYVDGTAGESETDTDRITETKYDSGGRRSELWAYNPKGSGNGVEIQKTRYLYGNTVNAAAPISNALMSNEIYPDSSDTDGTGTDQVKTGYDYLGRRKSLTDQRGVTRTFTYDSAGRMQADDVGTGSLPTGVDGTVRKVGRTYDDIGRVAKVTSYDASSGIVNEVKFTYGSYGQVTQSEQSHSGAVGSGTPAATYSYSDGAVSGEAKYLRLTSVGYPGGGRTVYSNYPSSGIGDMLSRLDNFANDSSGTSKYAQYTHLGAGSIVRVEHPAVTNGLTLNYGTGGTYSGLDRFGRVIDQKWTNGAGTSTFDRYQYVYDRSGNRISRANAQSSGKDEYYEYDGLHRLNKMNRGTLSSGTIADGSANFNQHWQTLETLGNWKSFRWDADGGADGWTTQSRVHNAANELGTISGTGADWIDPVHDSAGNMSQMPKPGDETTRLHATYDAWNRLAEVKSDNSGSPGGTIATYRYDGLNRRISKNINGGDIFDYYYNESWQLLETRKNADADPYEQYVWDQRYIDAPVLRWRDTNIDGTVDETLYYANDANMNVTALVDNSGTIQERYAYDPYGKVQVFDGSWTVRASSSHDNSILYAGYRYDSESGLCQVRNRYYHLTIGRWTSQDPLGKLVIGTQFTRVGPQRAGLWPRDAQQQTGPSGDGANLYQYVRGNPLIYVDPQGLQAASPSCYCGPDITNNLLAMATNVQNQWNGLSYWQRLKLSAGTITPGFAMGAWDINNLVQGNLNNAACGSGQGICAGTVTVNGRCYRQIAVNYWLAGLIYDALRSSWAFKLDGLAFKLEVFSWTNAKPWDPVGEKQEWFIAGTGGNPFNVPAGKGLTTCTPCQSGVNGLSWAWRFLSGMD